MLSKNNVAKNKLKSLKCEMSFHITMKWTLFIHPIYTLCLETPKLLDKGQAKGPRLCGPLPMFVVTELSLPPPKWMNYFFRYPHRLGFDWAKSGRAADAGGEVLDGTACCSTAGLPCWGMVTPYPLLFVCPTCFLMTQLFIPTLGKTTFFSSFSASSLRVHTTTRCEKNAIWIKMGPRMGPWTTGLLT